MRGPRLLASIVSDVAVLSSYPTLISSKYGINPVTLVVLPPQLEFPFHAVGRRRPQRPQRTLILISAIAKSSPFHSPRRLADRNDRILVGHVEDGGPTLHAG